MKGHDKNAQKASKIDLALLDLVPLDEKSATQANGGWLGFFIENLCFGIGHFQGYDNRGNML